MPGCTGTRLTPYRARAFAFVFIQALLKCWCSSRHPIQCSLQCLSVPVPVAAARTGTFAGEVPVLASLRSRPPSPLSLTFSLPVRRVAADEAAYQPGQ